MSSAEEQTEQLTQLIERLVVDASFRAEFRRDPIEISQAYGLDELAEEFRAQGAGFTRSSCANRSRASRAW